jgi:DNA invertase Pin-like site-specific DNA recombinase
MRIAVYARVSTADQHTENQLEELRRYATAREWTIHREYVDEGVSGAKESRPALDLMLKDARRRRFDVLLVWRLDRLGRSLRHLILLLDDLQALGVAFVSLAEGLDCTTPAGRLQLHVLGAIAEFERERIRERVRAGLARAKAHGTRLGRRPAPVSEAALLAVASLSLRDAARELGVSHTVVRRHRLLRKPSSTDATFAPANAGVRGPVEL